MLGRAADERVDLAQDALAQFVERLVGVRLEQLGQPWFAETLEVGVHRLADAVGEEHEQVPWREGQGRLGENLLETGPVVDPQPHDHPVGGEDVGLGLAAIGGRHVDERGVARPGVGHRTGGGVDDRVGHRDKTPAVEMLRDEPVRADEQVPGRLVDPRQREHQPLEFGHVERRRHALARHVRDQHADAPAVERQHVVVVAADLAGRQADRRHGQARHARRAGWQQGHLDLAREPHLFLETLLLGGLPQEILDAGRHQVERVREFAELVLDADRDAVAEVALADPFGPREQLVDRTRDRSREGEPHGERPDLDEDEQPREHLQEERQRVGVAARPEQRLRRGQPFVDVAEIEQDADLQHLDGAGGPVDVIEQGDPVVPGRPDGARRGGRVVEPEREPADRNARRVGEPGPGRLAERQVDDESLPRHPGHGTDDHGHGA